VVSFQLTIRKAALEIKRKQIDAQINAIDARNNKQARKDDTRRKIIAGGIVLRFTEKNPHNPVAATMLGLLDEGVEPRSRYLFPFLPAKEASPPNTEKAKKPKDKPAPASSASPDATAPAPAPAAEKIEPRPAPAPASAAEKIESQPAPAPLPSPLAARPQPQPAPLPSHAPLSQPPGHATAAGGFASMFKK
jgi:outer membrane biosynthesis protein TonB